MRTARIISAMALLLFGSAVVTFSLIVEPSGEIHSSVLTFFAETCTTALVLFGLQAHKREDKINPQNNQN